MNGIAFGQSASARYIKSRRSFDIAYTIEDNTYKRGAIQLHIEDICPTEDEYLHPQREELIRDNDKSDPKRQ